MEIENGKYYQIGRRTFWLLSFQRSVAAIGFLLLAALVNSARTTTLFPITPALNPALVYAAVGATGFAVLFLVIGIVMTLLEYGVSRVMLDDVSLRIVRGILSKNEVVIPYRRIQSVEIEQNLPQRILKVGHVVITTTTDLEQPSSVKNEEYDEVVPLMDYGLARAVAGALTSRAEIERMEIQPNSTLSK